MPGGHIYVFEGLIRQSRTPDELAGVIAHEIGHVAHRDGTRSLLQAAGLSFLFGMLLGDFTGGGLVVIAGKNSGAVGLFARCRNRGRSLQRQPDDERQGRSAGAGRDPRSHHGQVEPGSKILLDHPQTKDRIVAINAAANALPGKVEPMLSPADWAALKRICG